MGYPPVQVRTYKGRTRQEAGKRLTQDGPVMTGAGYQLASQSWNEIRGYSVAARLCFIVAAFFTVGGLFTYWPLLIGAILFVLIGLTGSTIHSGELSVTWTMTAPASAPQRPVVAAPVTSATLNPADQLRSLRALLDDGVISQQDHDAKKADLLDRM